MSLRRAAIVALALSAASVTGLAACGDDDGGDAATTTAPVGSGSDAGSGDAGSGDAGSDDASSGGAPTGDPGSTDLVESIGGSEARDAIDALGLEAKAGAIESAMGANIDRVEVDGDTVHLYLAEDGSFDAMMGCMVVGSILSDDEIAVIHQGGESTPCE